MKERVFKARIEKDGMHADAKMYNGHPVILEKEFNYAQKKGLNFAILDISGCYTKLMPQHFNKNAVLLPDGSRATMRTTGSNIKTGKVKLCLDDYTLDFVDSFVGLYGYVEAYLTRGGTHLDATPMQNGFLQGVKFDHVFQVESGTLAEIETPDGETHLSCIDKGYSVSSVKADVQNWNIQPKEHGVSNLFGELDPFTPELIDHLYGGIEEHLESLSVKDLFKNQLSRNAMQMYKTQEGADNRSKDDLVKIFGDMKSLDDFLEFASVFLNDDELETIKDHPVFRLQWTKVLTGFLYGFFTGGVRHTEYFKLISAPPHNKKNVLLSKRQDLKGFCVYHRQPVEGIESVQAGEMEIDNRFFCIPDVWQQIRLNVENKKGDLIAVMKGGNGYFEGGTLKALISPDGVLTELDESSFLVVEACEIRGSLEKLDRVDITVTESVQGFSCVALRAADMPVLNADADGDGLGVQPAQGKDGSLDLYRQHVKKSQVNGRKHVQKVLKDRTTLERDNSFVLCQCVKDAVKAGAYMGELNNYRERFLLYSPAQQEQLAKGLRKCNRRRFLDLIQLYSQVFLDAQKGADRHLRQKAFKFVEDLRGAQAETPLARGHVGRNPKKDRFGKNASESWFKNDLPDLAELQQCQGNVALMLQKVYSLFEQYALEYSEEGLRLSDFRGMFGTCEKKVFNIAAGVLRVYYSELIPSMPISGFRDNGKPVFKFDEASKLIQPEIERAIEKIAKIGKMSYENASDLFFVGAWRVSHQIYDGSFCFHVMRKDLIRAFQQR